MISLEGAGLCLCLMTAPGIASAQITYRVEPKAPDKTFAITLSIPHVHENIVRVQMPVWAPGAYFVANYATNVDDVSASAGGSAHMPLHVYRRDPNTWEIAAHGAGEVEVHYTVKNADVESADGVPIRAHISGPHCYLYVEERKTEPAELELLTPPGAREWRIATSLAPLSEGDEGVSSAGQHISRFKAPTYDVLADAPVEMGNFVETKFVAGGAPHRVVVYGQPGSIDKDKLTDYCKRIATEETAFFGGAPFERYVFEFRATSGQTFGESGLEHLGSTEIGTISKVDDGLRSVIAHEYFHAWNVKRIRPFVLGPFNYIDPPHTANLWWSEGITSYYADLLSLRAGINTSDEYLKHVGQVTSSLQNNPARLKVSADESSYRVWEANNSSGYGGLSYYVKGELAGLCLDLKIRQVTRGNRSLDDVMRALFDQVRHGAGPGFAEDDIEKTVNRISGANLSDFYDSLVRSTDELPLAECLGYAGIKLNRVEPPQLRGDAGMAAQFSRGIRGIAIGEVVPGGAADKAGLKVGDTVVTVNGDTNFRRLGNLLSTSKPGDKLMLSISHGGALRDVELTLGTRADYRWSVTPDAGASPEQMKIRQAWMTNSGLPNSGRDEAAAEDTAQQSLESQDKTSVVSSFDDKAQAETWRLPEPFNLHPGDLPRGEKQVELMVRDRPEMARYVAHDSPVWRWCVRQFAGAALGHRIYWNKSAPMAASDGADYVPSWHGSHTSIRISLRETESDGSTQPARCNNDAQPAERIEQGAALPAAAAPFAYQRVIKKL